MDTNQTGSQPGRWRTNKNGKRYLPFSHGTDDDLQRWARSKQTVRGALSSADPETKMFGVVFLTLFILSGLMAGGYIGTAFGSLLIGISVLSLVLCVIFGASLLDNVIRNLRESKQMRKELAWREEDRQNQVGL